jgi:hypothetical protein
MFVETSTGIIRENLTYIIMQKNIIRIAIGTGLILLIPLVLTLLGDGVDGQGWNWKLGDFIFAFVLLFGTGLAYELIARKSDNSAYRFAVGIAVVSALLLVWVNAAVGIIGEPGGPNLMYFGVLAVGFIGALIARFRPHGMARTLFTMALAQILVPVIALVIAKPQVVMEAPGVVGVFGLNIFFAMLLSDRLCCFGARRVSTTKNCRLRFRFSTYRLKLRHYPISG